LPRWPGSWEIQLKLAVERADSVFTVSQKHPLFRDVAVYGQLEEIGHSKKPWFARKVSHEVGDVKKWMVWTRRVRRAP
jgi:hypothetical protein